MRSPSLHNRHCVSRFQVAYLANDSGISHTERFLDEQKVQVKTYYACLRMCKFRTVFGVTPFFLLELVASILHDRVAGSTGLVGC